MARPVVLVVLFLLLIPAASAEPVYDLSVVSADWEPSSPVTFTATGLGNQSLSLKILDQDSTIVHGKDNLVLVNGTLDYVWTPVRTGAFNVTVTFSTGVSITKSFLILRVFSEQDVALIYQTLFREVNALKSQIATLLSYIYIAAAIGAGSVLISIYLMKRTLDNLKSQGQSELEHILSQRATEIAQSLKKKKGK